MTERDLQFWLEPARESFWGDLYGQTKLASKAFWEGQSRQEKRRSYRSGFYVRDFVTRLATLRLRIARPASTGSHARTK